MLTPIYSNPKRNALPAQQLPGDTATVDASKTPALVLLQTPTASEQKPLITPTPNVMLTTVAIPTPTVTYKAVVTPGQTYTSIPTITSTPTAPANITPKPTYTSTPTKVPTPTATYTPVATPTQKADPTCLPKAEPTLWLEVEGNEASFTVGEEISIRICASGLVTGLAGFILTISAQNGNIVEFAAVELPKFGLQTSTPLPDSTVEIRAADFADLIPKNTESALLATINVLAKSSGSTPLSITVKALDDDDGFPVTLKTLQITLNVTAN